MSFSLMISDWCLVIGQNLSPNQQSPINNHQSAINNSKMGWAGGEGIGLRHGRSPLAGRRSLHVEEQRGPAAPRGEMTRPLLGHLPSLFALLTPNGERQCPKPLLPRLLTA